MDQFTIATINLVIGLFTTLYFATEYCRNRPRIYLADFSFAGVCLTINSILAILRDHTHLPYFLVPGVANAATICVHLFVLSALYRLFQVPLQRYFLLALALFGFLLMFLPALQQAQLNRLITAYALIIVINMLCLRLLRSAKDIKFNNVVTFFECIMLFNIGQLLLRGLLFVTEKYGITHLQQNPLTYQLGWFALTIYAGLILTGGLVALARQRQLELEMRAERDPLTGLLNRFSMRDRLQAEINRGLRSNQPLTLLMFDIDHFKRVNDNFGHQAGDLVIQDVAAVTQTTFRNYDLAFRIGGEEFLVCLPGVCLKQAAEKAELLRQQIQTRQVLPETQVTISIGFAVANKTQDLDIIIKHADDALYQAKRLGRNQVVGWSDMENIPLLHNSGTYSTT